MKYYAVTDDPMELYHYGVKGMKWGQHIFGDKPKSPGYHRALKKLRTNVQKASSATAKTVSKVAKAAKKTATQIGYDVRAKQQNRFEKSVAKAQAKLDKSNVKFDNYQADVAKKSAEKQINKAVNAVKRRIAINNAKETIRNASEVAGETIRSASKIAGKAIRNASMQAAYDVRRAQDNRFQKAVQKAQDRNKLSDALRNLDQENKAYKQVERERKMDALREKQADVMANNDLKSLQKAVRVEKNMPKYYQEARTGMLSYGKLSDEQIGRLQNRLALEANTRRLGSTEAPSWRQQKKAARRQGYLQGITKGIAAGMEEVGRASVQYGIQNYMNRKKMDNASEQKAQREKAANRIKSKKTHHEIDQDIKQEAYEARAREGENVIRRNLPTLSTALQAKRLQAIDNAKRERQNVINDANDERKFLMEEKHNASRDERQRQKKLAEHNQDVDSIGESLVKNGYAIIPSYDKQGKKNGSKLLVRDSDDREAKAYIALYNSKHNSDSEIPKIESPAKVSTPKTVKDKVKDVSSNYVVPKVYSNSASNPLFGYSDVEIARINRRLEKSRKRQAREQKEAIRRMRYLNY